MIYLILHFDSSDFIALETFLVQNRVEHRVFRSLWEGYFNSICEVALENIIIEKGLSITKEMEIEIIEKITNKLDADESNFVHLLFKAEELARKEFQTNDKNR